MKMLTMAMAFAMVCSAPNAFAQKVKDVETREELEQADILGLYWELDEEQKRGTFELRTYQPNFILPATYTSAINTQPSSPTRGMTTPNVDYKDIETKLQLSLRTKIFEDFLLPNADVWVSYTQTSMWQAWNTSESSPFRSTDYNPDVFYVVPVTEQLDPLPGDINLRALQVGFAHQSNGQREPDSRSWNYFHFGGKVELNNNFFWESTYKKRVEESREEDDNPDLVHYRGNFENTFAWRLGASTFALKRKSPNFSFNRGSWQFDFTHPIDSDKPDGLRFYIQLFSGYGETLLDYNHRQNRIGIGFLLINL